MEKEIRLLTADEIDVRVAQTTNYNGVVKVNLLLYKDARVDMKILDELYGTMGWKRSHQLIGDRLYCTIEVWDTEKGCWIAKQDVGTESNTEPEKGQASDAFKRAGFNWGIGRELYTAPKIQVTLNQKEYADRGGRIQVWASFSVGVIDYDEDRKINRLAIIDKAGNIRFELGAKQSRRAPAKAAIKPANAPVDLSNIPIPASLTDAAYWSIVNAAADGRPTKAGGYYRTAFINECNPTPEQVARFDSDVENCLRGRLDRLASDMVRETQREIENSI